MGEADRVRGGVGWVGRQRIGGRIGSRLVSGRDHVRAGVTMAWAGATAPVRSSTSPVLTAASYDECLKPGLRVLGESPIMISRWPTIVV